MHRAACKALRTTSTYLTSVWRVSRGGASSSRRTLVSARSRSQTEPLRSSMYIRRLPIALVSSVVVGYGAWYSYTKPGTAPGTAGARSFTFTQGAAAPRTGNIDPARTVLVVGPDDLTAVVGELPLSKATSDDGRKVVEMLTAEQATQVLRRNEESLFVNRGEGVIRYDVVQLPSNGPIEDDHAEKIVEMPSWSAQGDGKIDWMFWGVFDGHSGWTTSATLRQSLIGYVARELNATFKAAKHATPASEAIDLAIKKGFIRLDEDIVHKSVEKTFKASSKAVAAELLQPALSGSCALLSFYDSSTQLLRIACTGDSRAVLGRRLYSGKWAAKALSEDQTGGNPREAARMRKEHPGEADVVRNGRVLGGLEPTRAFGDAIYKWSQETAQKLRTNFFGRRPSNLLKTPPYVTAEPVITTTKINPQRGDFLVLATDGLWEMLTNDEVVGLVGQWIENQAGSTKSNSQFETAWSKIFGSAQKPLPVEKSDEKGVDGQKEPMRLQQWGVDPDALGRFTFKDKNVATHLVRNALGGSNDEQVRALLTLPAPFARRYRDDLTVQVIFFGDGDRTGEVTLNLDATAEPATPKARL